MSATILSSTTSTAELLAQVFLDRPRAVGVNDAGHVVGQDHHSAKMTDEDVHLILELRDAGLTHRAIAAKFEVSIHAVRSISCGRRRAHTAVGQKRT